MTMLNKITKHLFKKRSIRLRSLSVKLTFAFLVVGLAGIMLVALFVWERTHTEFNRFVYDQNQNFFLSILAEYYTINHSWDGVEKHFLPHGAPPTLDENGPRPQVIGTLVDVNRLVVIGSKHNRVGLPVSDHDFSRAVPLTIDNGQIVGYFIFDDRFGDSRTATTPENVFLHNVGEAIFFGGIGATVFALVLGVLLARTLARPISELTAATRVVAGGDLGHQVKVRSKDELGELAKSFNQMSLNLENARKLRRQMTADIAHDLRTPLSILLGYTEALSDGKFNGTPEIFQVMHNETKHLSHLIDDLRTLSLADAGELHLTLQWCAPHELLERIVAAHQAQAGQKGVALVMNALPDLPLVQVDPERMVQVLGNLVSNALRFTPDGGQITLSAAAKADTLLLRVVDTGCGIAPEDVPYIFDRFYRADQSRHQYQGESGLGLAIARSIVEAHGGGITVESTPGVGTTFTITLNL